MAFEFLKELLEAGNEHPLLNNPEFISLQKAAPDFANKLATAWNGDAREYNRTHGKNAEMLFPMMLDNITKYVPNVKVTFQVQKLITDLKRLQTSAFPPVPASARIDTGVWQHEPWARESVDTEYAALREEYEELSEE